MQKSEKPIFTEEDWVDYQKNAKAMSIATEKKCFKIFLSNLKIFFFKFFPDFEEVAAWEFMKTQQPHFTLTTFLLDSVTGPYLFAHTDIGGPVRLLYA